MKKQIITLVAIAFCGVASANTNGQGTNPGDGSKGLLAVSQRTTTMHCKTGIKKSNGDYDCSVSGSECDVTITIITKDFVVPNPPGFNPPAGSEIGRFTTNTGVMTETQWIPESNNVRTVNPADGSVENINIPEQAGYYSPEVNAYLFYYYPAN